MLVLEILLLVLAVLLCIPAGMFCVEVALSLLPRKTGVTARLSSGVRVVVLIPAHNEEAVIGATLQTLMPTMPAGGRVLVVGDNCTDRTAALARECGAEAIERSDQERRGKGYALDFGIQHLQHDAPAAVVFLDADCRVGPKTVELLAATAISLQRPVQGLNLCDPDPSGSGGQLASGLAFRFKNLVRTLGLVRLAGLCHLTGTGMGLPWSLIQKAQLAGGNVVEDMQLGIDLALAGKPAVFLPEARVDSPLPQQASAVRTQRTRWEHGHLRTLLRQSPRLVALAVRHGRLDLLWLAMDLAIPPLALLVGLLAACTAVTAIAWGVGFSPWPLILTSNSLIGLVTAVFLGWSAHCRDVIPARALVAAPLYVLKKLPIYLAFIWKPQQQWIRTQRDAVQT